MEQFIGRKLGLNEHVHHKNGNPLDNRLENLELLTCREHMCLHKQIYPDIKICAKCGNKFIVNPRKRKRNTSCSKECAKQLSIMGRKKQNERFWRSRKSLVK